MNSFLGAISEQAQQQVDQLNQQIAELQQEIERCEQEVRELLEREARGEGVFAAEVFERKQRKMMLTTEIQHKKVRINHILLGSAPEEA